jgi:hypothetical protein
MDLVATSMLHPLSPTLLGDLKLKLIRGRIHQRHDLLAQRLDVDVGIGIEGKSRQAVGGIKLNVLPTDLLYGHRPVIPLTYMISSASSYYARDKSNRNYCKKGISAEQVRQVYLMLISHSTMKSVNYIYGLGQTRPRQVSSYTRHPLMSALWITCSLDLGVYVQQC